MAWYREWFGEDYLELYAHRDAEEAERSVDFATERFGEAGGPVLDLACGAGRHSRSLADRDFAVVGLDLSLVLLAHAGRGRFAGGDMRRLPFPDGHFAWVLNFFTSFGYFETERQNFEVLEEIARVLRPRGRFLLDLMNVERTLAELTEYEHRREDGREIEIRRWYDAPSRRINKRITLHNADRPTRTFLESVRAYAKDEVVIGLRWAGLEVEEIFGGFDGQAFGPESPRLILVGHRAPT